MKLIATVFSFLILCSLFVIMPAHAGGKVMVTTVVKDFVYTGGNIGCPKSADGPAFVVDLEKYMGNLTEREMERLMNLLDQFESEHGVKVDSKSSVEDLSLTSDVIRTSTSGPYDGVGKALCDLMRSAL